MGDEPVLMCEDHCREQGVSEGGVMKSSSADFSEALLDGRIRGLNLTIRDWGVQRFLYKSTFEFTCSTHDAPYSTKASKWTLNFMGDGGFSREGILSEFDNVKAMRLIRKVAEVKEKPKEDGQNGQAAELEARIEARRKEIEDLERTLIAVKSITPSAVLEEKNEDDPVQFEHDFDFLKMMYNEQDQ